jgi:hypothetical protein
VAEHTGADVVVFFAKLCEVIGADERGIGRSFASGAARSLPRLLALRGALLRRLLLALGFGSLTGTFGGSLAFAFGGRSALAFCRCSFPLFGGFLFDAAALGAFAFNQRFGFETFAFGFEAALLLFARAFRSGRHFGLEALAFLDPLSLGGFGFLSQAFGLAFPRGGGFGFEPAAFGFLCPLGSQLGFELAALVFARLLGSGFGSGFCLLSFFLARLLGGSLRFGLGTLPFFLARALRGGLGFCFETLPLLFARLVGDRLCRGFRFLAFFFAGAGGSRCRLRFGVGARPFGLLPQLLRAFPFRRCRRF